MSDTTGSDGQSTPENGGSSPEVPKTFTQDEVDQIVKDRAERLYKQRVGDVDIKDLKARAEGAKTLEDRIADLESNGAKAEARALRAEIAAEYGISTKRAKADEPSDAELFLTGTDEVTLRAQAERLGARVADRKKQGNVAPTEGVNQNPGDSKGDERAFARQLFGKTD